jgi:methylated-DNA-[protein]-cysteine S-methyltransferase
MARICRSPPVGEPVMSASDTMATPVGELLLSATDHGLTRVHFASRYLEGADTVRRRSDGTNAASALLAEARAQLKAYFSGELIRFTVPIAPEGTDFQRRVWGLLTEIPYGETISYAELANRMGDSRSVRAVGAANGRNPLAIVVPCHRVIGSDGSLIGFGGGLDRKKWLLIHERSVAVGV